MMKSPNKDSSLLEEWAFERYCEGLGMNEQVLLTIVKTLDSYTNPISCHDSECKRDERIFSHWILEEILDLIWDHPWTPASDTIEKFAHKLQMYAATSVTKKQERIFTIAANTAWELFEDIQKIEKQ